MNSPKIHHNTLNSNNQPYFVPNHYNPPLIGTSQSSKQLTANRFSGVLNQTGPQTPKSYMKPNLNSSFEHPVLKTTFSLNLDQNLSGNKQNGITYTSRQTPQQSNDFLFKKPAITSREQLSSPQPNKNPELFLGFNDNYINKFSLKIDNSSSKLGSVKQNSNIIKPVLSTEEYEKKIKGIESQLKFEEKYSNDLYKEGQKYKAQIAKLKDQNAKLTERGDNFQSQNNLHIDQIKKITQYSDDLFKTSEGYKVEIAKLKEQNSKLAERGDHFQAENNRHIDQIKNMTEEMTNKDKRIVHLGDLIGQKDLRISKLQAYSRSQNVIISDLNSKIMNFNQYFNNEIYEERIKSLNEEIIKIQNKSNDLCRQKNRLTDELRIKNEKLALMNLEKNSGESNGDRTSSPPRNVSTNDMANKMITRSFEEAIKHYQNGIEQLKVVIENKTDDNRKLSEEIIESKKEIQSIKQQMHILSLKHSTEIKNAAQQNQNRLIQKQNQISSLNNRLKLIEERYATAIKEINKKDEFLKEHLVGRTKELEQKQHIESLLKEYVNTFDSRLALVEKVRLLQEQIQKYEAPLLD